MHLGLNGQAVRAPYQFKGNLSLCWSSRWPPLPPPQTYTLNVLWLQEEVVQIHMSERSQSFTFTQNVCWGFILRSAPPTQWTVWQPHWWRCLLRVLHPERRPVTTLDFVLLKALAPRQGPDINSGSCLWDHHTQCWLTNESLILLISCLETLKAGSGPTNFTAEPPLVSPLVILYPRTPACPETQYSPTAWQVEISFNASWLCWTNGDVVLMTWRAFKAT